MSIKTFKRYENKYLLDDRQYTGLIGELGRYMKPDEYCVDGKKYTIYNIYYDTEHNDIIRHSMTKPYYKEKLRLRSYTPFDSPDDKVFMEIKKKIGGIVSKRRAVMTLREAVLFTQTGQKPVSNQYLDTQVIEEIAFFLKMNEVSPKVFIQYDRQAFFGIDNSDFRLTLDSGIQSRRSNLFVNAPKMNQQLLEDNRYLLEIKISDSIPLWLTHTLADLGIASESFSKYGTEYKKFMTPARPNIVTFPYAPVAIPQGLCVSQ